MRDKGSDHWYREAFDEYYVDLYGHRDKEEAVQFARFLGSQVVLTGALVLDLACGGGRYMQALSSAGARPVGVDLSVALLREAAGAGAVSLVRGDMRTVPFANGVFDGAISMFTSFGYFPEIDDEMAVLEEVWRCLKPGGWFVIDHMNSSLVRRSLEPASSRDVRDLTVVEERRMGDDGERVIKEIRLYDGGRLVKEHTEVVRLLSKDELHGMLARAGFEPLRFLGDYFGGGFEADESPRMIAFCRKR